MRRYGNFNKRFRKWAYNRVLGKQHLNDSNGACPMKKSWINRVMFLLMGTLISSLLFLVVISVTYNSFYRQSVLGSNNGIADNWATSVDGRLNTIY